MVTAPANPLRGISIDSDYTAAWDDGSHLTFHAGVDVATAALHGTTRNPADEVASPT